MLKKNLIKLSVLEKSSIINDKIENSFTNIFKEKYNIFFLAYLDPIGHAQDIEKNGREKTGCNFVKADTRRKAMGQILIGGVFT